MTHVAAQNMEAVMASVERNNLTLKVLREETDARKFAGRAGVALPGPEIGFGYLWGSPAGTGSRTDLSLTQRLDVPTIIGMKGRLADQHGELAETGYRAGRAAILAEAQRLCIELVHSNLQNRELRARVEHAETVAAHYRQRLDAGDANRLEFNRAQLSLSTLRSELRRAESNRNALSASLAQLNGGEATAITDTLYAPLAPPEDFELWFESVAPQSPAMVGAAQEAEAGRRELSLSKASSWPSLTAGYMSERTMGQRYGGLTVGLSIPLWENSGRIRQARAGLRAAESRRDNVRVELHSRLKILYTRALELREALEQARAALNEADSRPLLQKSLDAGAISLAEYLASLTLQYEAVDDLLATERDYILALADMRAAGF
jgi:outer membrane protein TolC